MTKHNVSKRSYWTVAWVAVTAALFGSVAATSAAYVDFSKLNLGGTGIGDPNLFSIQVLDAGVSASTWVEAEDYASAVVLPTSPDNHLRIDVPIEYDVYVRVDPTSPNGNITPVLYVGDDCVGRCAALYGQMLFDIYVDGTLIATEVSADEFNALTTRTIVNNAPGDEHLVQVYAHLKSNTPFMWRGDESMFGVKFEGVSTP